MKLIVWFILPAALCAQASHPTFWRYTHPQAQMLLGIDLERVGQSAFGQRLKKELAVRGMEKSIPWQGLDFLPQVDRILVSSPAGLDSAGKKPEKTPAVLAFSGRFDILKLRNQLVSKGGRRSFYKGVELITRPGQAGEMILGLVNGQIMLLGDPVSVRAAIENHLNTEPGAAHNELFDRAMNLSKTFDAWFVSEASPGDIDEFKLSGFEQLAAAVSQFEGGISFRDGLTMELNFDAEEQETAKQLATALQGLLQASLMGAAGSNRASAEDFLHRLAVGTADGWVAMKLSYPQKDLDESLDQILAGGKGNRKTTTAGDAPRPAAKPEPPPPLVVKIFNAEGGPKQHGISPR